MARGPLRSSRLRVGVDIVGVSEVAQSLDRFGARYVRRVFTDAEAEYCGAVTGRAAAARFAARFAAKEATFKALRPEEPPVDCASDSRALGSLTTSISSRGFSGPTLAKAVRLSAVTR